MKILVAEDSAMMRHALVSMLRRWGYDFVEAGDGKEAWELVLGIQPPIVLTDWMMPGMDGLELMRRIRSQQSVGYVYMILLTAKNEKADLVQAMDAGADDFLTKPVDPDELRVRLRAGERIIRLERKLAEQNQELRDTQVALVQSEKLASLGQMAAGMAHEINNPLAYVTNNLAVLKNNLLDIVQVLHAVAEVQPELANCNPDLADRVAQIAEQCDLEWIRENLPRLIASSVEGLDRVRDTVRNLRDFARLDEADLDEIDLNKAVESTLELLQYEIEAHEVEMRCELQPLPLVLCRPTKINQVLHSVLLNAIQASHPNGIVTLCTMTQGEEVVIEVKDRGVGIPEKDLSSIFEPFFTTHAVGAGSGLGLTVSYGIVENHEGRIEVESTVGQGSLFRICLPFRHP